MSEWKSCSNCGATIAIATPHCARCNELVGASGSGHPRFSEQSREAAWSLGGLLNLHEIDGNNVRYICECAGGATGMTEKGELVWVADYGHLAGLRIDGRSLFLNGKRVDVETGSNA